MIIPKGNVPQLMLDDNVIQAVTNGKFHIWPIAIVDGGLELLAGQDPGELKDDGTYPEGSINHAAATRLVEFADAVRSISAGAEKNLKDDEGFD